MKKRVCALLLVTVMLLSLAACGGSASSGIQTSSGSASNKSDSEEPVTITYYTWETAEENNPVWQEIEDKLNIRVEVCILPDTGGTDKESALDIVAMSGSEMDFRNITETSPAQRIENGFASISLHEGLARSLNWYWAHPKHQIADEEYNRWLDALISEWSTYLYA